MSEYEKTAKIFKAFCDANRLKILEQLSSGEKCACKLLENMDIGHPTLSHHMKILCDAGIVTVRKQGKWMHYSFNEDGIGRARELLEKATTTTVQSMDDMKKCAC